MTGNAEDTGQISVAELLARNGQQVESRGGRRRRGASGGISVAELTGELPVIDGAPTRNRRAAPDPDDDVAVSVPASATAWPATNPPAAAPVETPEEPAAVETPAQVEAPAVVEKPAPVAAAQPEPVDHTQAIPALRRAMLAKADADRKAAADRAAQVKEPAPTVAAPALTPKPVAPTPPTTAGPAATERTQVVDKATSAAEQTVVVAKVEQPKTQRPAGPAKSYRGTPDVREPALLSGSSVEAELMRNARSESLEEARAQVHTTGEFPRIVDTDSTVSGKAASSAKAVEATDESEKDAAPESKGSAVRQWAVLAGQAVVAIVAGALLFKGFEKLWDSLPWVALVLAVLVIAGLVAVVRILRQTEDLLSLLIAVIVGVFVTIGPLVFVLSSS